MGFFRWCCSTAADFLPTFMYCMGSGNFDVVQTALRNLPEYVLLCQGMIVPSSQHYTASVLGLYYGAKLASWKVNCSVFSRCTRIHAQSKHFLHRACRHLTPQGLLGGDLWADWHQLYDLWVHEGPAHGGNNMRTRRYKSFSSDGRQCHHNVFVL